MKFWGQLSIFILIGVLAGFSWLTLSGHFAVIDAAIIRVVYRWRSPGLTTTMLAISLLGNQVLFVASAGIVVFLVARKRWADMGRYLVLVAGQELINNLFKILVARPRPDNLPLAHETSYSFPSGHSMAAVVFYGALAIWLRRKNYGGRYANWGWFVLAALLALLIGISRVYLGVHYPSDVLAGFLVGTVWLLIFLRVTK